MYEIHLRTVHEEPKIKYDKNFHAERRFVCQKCEASFSGRAQLRAQIASVHESKSHFNVVIKTPTLSKQYTTIQ